MIGLDTNIVVRYLTLDEPDQAARATALLDDVPEDEPAFLSIVALAEIAWVLRRWYGLTRDEVASRVAGLAAAREVALESPDLVSRALRRMRHGAEFSDAVVVEQSLAAGCDQVMTFDRRRPRRRDDAARLGWRGADPPTEDVPWPTPAAGSRSTS